MLAGLALAASCAVWHPAATGHYPGVVMSEGVKLIDAWIEVAPDGRLQGHYVLHEPAREVAGTLDAIGDESCNVALFRWTDLYGTGMTRLVFDPASHCFDGAWGRESINPALVWHACAQERVTS